jgi:hypothetical protein
MLALPLAPLFPGQTFFQSQKHFAVTPARCTLNDRSYNFRKPACAALPLLNFIDFYLNVMSNKGT